MAQMDADAVRDLGALDQDILDRAEAGIRANRELNITVVQRRFWTHGVATLPDDLASAELFTRGARAEHIRCPRTLLRATAADGAGNHCAMQNRSLVNRRTFDWLDEQFGLAGCAGATAPPSAPGPG